MADPTNSDIADALAELGDLYELDGAIVHRVVAYVEAFRGPAEGERRRPVRGCGQRAEENTLAARGPAPGGEMERRVVLARALAVGEPIVAALRAHPASDKVELAGSARRMADSCKDLDIIATAKDADALVEAFVALPEIESVGGSGGAGARVRTHSGIKVDLRVVAPEQFGNLLQHFTGSRAHNMALRDSAVRRGLHVSEYGVLDDATA